MMMQSFPIFIESIFMEDLVHLDYKKIKKYCKIFQKQNSHSVMLSNRGGFQSIDNIFKDENFFILFDTIKLKFNEIEKIYNFNKKLIIDNAWININISNSYNLEHFHPNSIISGVLYIDANPNQGDLTFVYPSNTREYHLNSLDIKNYNEFNCSTFSIKPKTGLLVLFPSWLPHRVDANNTKKERISISFNTKFI